MSKETSWKFWNPIYTLMCTELSFAIRLHIDVANRISITAKND